MDTKTKEILMSTSKNPPTPRKSSRPKALDLVTVPPPVTPADRIVLGIRKLIASSIFFNSQVADKVGIGLTDMQMLHMLQLHGPSTPSRLAAWTGLSSGGVTVALDRLAAAGFIRRQPNPADRRSLLIALNPARMRKVAPLYQRVEADTRDFLATLPTPDLHAVARFFDTLSSAHPNTNH
jgi:MarR family transcriptional regulator, organic hydroperoxide resistance regulator